MTLQEYNVKVWPFYLRLENDFLNTLNYVEFSEDNFSTYSIEYEKQKIIGSMCPDQQFTKFWTLKESFVKCIGTGIFTGGRRGTYFLKAGD